MTAEDLLDAYRDEMAPTLGLAFIEGFIARNRSSMLRMLAPLVALMNERTTKARLAQHKVVESALLEIREIDLSDEDRDYFLNEARRFADKGQVDRLAGLLSQARSQAQERDEVTPEKDAIVWAAFRDLVNEKRRAFGMQELDEMMESMPFGGRSVGRIRDRGWGSEVAADKLTVRNREVSRRKVQRHREQIGAGHPIAITLRHPKRRDLVAMVTASASEPGRYQLTWADHDGPSGHTTRDTPEEAVRHAVDEGYRLDTANSSEAREMVERVQQERERRAAEIESWLTESLPSRKTSSSQTAQQFIASFMRWKPHDRMYYELLELRPEATTQEIEAKWGRSLKLTDILNPRRPMYRDSSVQRQAFDVLTNPGWRRDYDANGNLDASFQGLRQRALDATLMVASGDAMTDQDREVLLGVAEMGPEAYALHRNLRLPEVVAKTREILHEMDADDAKYRLPYKTESLPAPKHAGRMGDGFKVGEHVIRIGDMIKMEGQLGGYVESVDRVRGTAKIEQDNGETKTWPLASLLHDTKANRERQQEHNDKINAEAEARLELSLADWRAR